MCICSHKMRFRPNATSWDTRGFEATRQPKPSARLLRKPALQSIFFVRQFSFVTCRVSKVVVIVFYFSREHEPSWRIQQENTELVCCLWSAVALHEPMAIRARSWFILFHISLILR